MLSRKRFGVGLLFVVAMLTSAMAFAGGGLGQRWPNAQDLSRSGAHHAYRWDNAGVAYVQVNDANGNPQLAVATGNGVILPLPVGNPQNVVISAVSTASQSVGVLVYQDDAITVQQTPDGRYVVSPIVTAAGCNDPAECTRPPLVAPASTSSTAAPATQSAFSTLTCGDPAECTRINAQ